MRIHHYRLAYIALVVVCLIWGTSYFAIQIGVRTFPPFLFTAIRHSVAGSALLAGLAVTGNLKLNRRDSIHQAIAGILMLAIGNGLIGWCERYISSGLAALVLSLTPLFVVTINYVSGLDKRKPNGTLILGLVSGCLGIVLIFDDNLKQLSDIHYLKGVLIAFVACFAIALGIVYAKHKTSAASNVFQNAALQLFSAGITLFFSSAFLDDFSELKSISLSGIEALVYLILFGSILAYSCFVYALKKLPIGVVSIYAYVNPFVAIILGFLFLHERLTVVMLLALVATLNGIYLINKGYLTMAEN